MATVLPQGSNQFFDNAGNPLAGGTLRADAAGTNTLKAIFADAAGTVPLANPLTLDSAGRATIFWDGAYKVTLRDSANNLIWTVDNIQGDGTALRTDLAANSGSSLVTFLQSGTGAIGRPVQDALREMHINAKSWNTLIGNGTADSAAAINAAIVAANARGGGVVFLPRGVYIAESQITLLANVTLMGEGAATIIRAKSTGTQEYVILAQNVAGACVRDLTVDCNQAARVAAGLTGRAVGVAFIDCTEPLAFNVTARNAVGNSANTIPGIGIVFGGLTFRGRIQSCILTDCGVSGRAADGVFMSGTQNLCTDSIALNCNDTGFVIESSQYSGLVGCTTNGCSAVAAITNASAVVSDGNFIDGLTGYNWSSIVTGGIQIGNPSSGTTGDLRNTRVSNVTLERTSGSGPAVNVRRTGTAKTIDLTLENIRIKGAGTQGMLINAEDVLITDCTIRGQTNNSAIQIQNGSARISIADCMIRGQFTFGVYSDGVSDVDVKDCRIAGDGVNSTHGVYFAGTATSCFAIDNLVTGVTTARVGSDAGTTPLVMAPDVAGGVGVVLTKADQRIITSRQGGYSPMTGTANRGTVYASGTITLVQLAERVKALQDDLTAHGLIGV